MHPNSDYGGSVHDPSPTIRKKTTLRVAF